MARFIDILSTISDVYGLRNLTILQWSKIYEECGDEGPKSQHCQLKKERLQERN